MSSASGVLKSTDNGKTFTNIKTGAYLSVIGDGTHLYTGVHFNSRYVTALESNDTAWSDFNTQDFDEGPFQMALDSTNGILYGANIRAGVWALKINSDPARRAIKSSPKGGIWSLFNRARWVPWGLPKR